MTALLQRLGDLESALERERIDPAPFAAALARIRAHLETYAKLETELLGHATVTYPRHLVEGAEVESLEDLADRERRRLELDRHETGLMEVLDREGLKVYRVHFPAGAGLEGLFLFDPDIGPVLVVDAGLPRRDADLVFARLYGIFLLDTDPYRIRLARPAGADTDRQAERGFEFAAALLVGRRPLLAYLTALGWSEGQPVTSGAVEQMAVYFDVRPRTILARILTLGLPVAGLAESLQAEGPAGAAGSGGPPAPAQPAAPETVLPERFVRLALEAHARGALSLARLARALETDEVGAQRLAARFRLEDAASPGTGDGAS